MRKSAAIDSITPRTGADARGVEERDLHLDDLFDDSKTTKIVYLAPEGSQRVIRAGVETTQDERNRSIL